MTTPDAPTSSVPPIKAPWPQFGGKSRAARLIWERFGDPPNYVEPFAGSLAVLLGRPTPPRTETVNDLDGLLSNAWRAIRLNPDAVSQYADAPVVEVDLHAKHFALVAARQGLTERLMADPDFYDARLAGYWIWGACNYIGSGWCDGSGPWRVEAGRIIHRRDQESAQALGFQRKLPHLGDAGRGINRALPSLGSSGTGITRKLVNLSSHGSGTNSVQATGNPGLYEWMRALSTRIRRTRICCGDWTRVLGESVTVKHGLTAVFLDPPYNAENADNDVYAVDHDSGLSAAVREWAAANGENPKLRICVAGYDGEHDFPDSWEVVRWQNRKGYQRADAHGVHNGHRETLWFSPACLRPAPPEPDPDPMAGTLWDTTRN